MIWSCESVIDIFRISSKSSNTIYVTGASNASNASNANYASYANNQANQVWCMYTYKLSVSQSVSDRYFLDFQ